MNLWKKFNFQYFFKKYFVYISLKNKNLSLKVENKNEKQNFNFNYWYFNRSSTYKYRILYLSKNNTNTNGGPDFLQNGEMPQMPNGGNGQTPPDKPSGEQNSNE